MQFRTPTIEDLRLFFPGLHPNEPQVGADDAPYVKESPVAFVEGRIAKGTAAAARYAAQECRRVAQRSVRNTRNHVMLGVGWGMDRQGGWENRKGMALQEIERESVCVCVE